ncbi:MAG TPA: DUF2267 domain-containing protein [bacterium]|nr:DUF2267 domain-containing protein [bacterium]
MSSSGLDVFDHTIQSTNIALGKIEDRLGWSNEQRNQSYLALRVLLHAIRDRLPINEAIQLSSSFPLLIKGVYFDGWDPKEKLEKLNKAEFIERLRRQFPFDVEGGIESVVGAVMGVVIEMTPSGEIADVLNSLPANIAEFLIGIEEVE